MRFYLCVFLIVLSVALLVVFNTREQAADLSRVYQPSGLSQLEQLDTAHPNYSVDR